MTTQTSNSISDERNFRPKTLEDFIGQGDLKKTLRLILDSAHQSSDGAFNTPSTDLQQ
jgi:Holliday junction resolvasome RuvABC ATP-dependent DNA helicase subunit